MTALLCDADGTLFPSEEPAFAASEPVVNRYLEGIGSPQRFTAEELRLSANGRSFRSTLTTVARQQGVAVDAEPFLSEVSRWVAEENEAVTTHLAEVLKPDPAVREPLGRLAARYDLAVVTSSTLTRIVACLDATGLADLFDPAARFSAQDSLARPTSKPDPAVYLWAGTTLGLSSEQALAVEDAVAGAQSAVGAGFCTIGMLGFVPASERVGRREELEKVGVSTFVDSWTELATLLSPST